MDEGPPPVIADDAADVLSPNLPYSSAADSENGEASRSRALAALDFDGASNSFVLRFSFKAIYVGIVMSCNIYIYIIYPIHTPLKRKR